MHVSIFPPSIVFILVSYIYNSARKVLQTKADGTQRQEYDAEKVKGQELPELEFLVRFCTLVSLEIPLYPLHPPKVAAHDSLINSKYSIKFISYR